MIREKHLINTIFPQVNMYWDRGLVCWLKAQSLTSRQVRRMLQPLGWIYEQADRACSRAVGVLGSPSFGDQADSFFEFRLDIIVAVAILAATAIVGWLLLKKNRMTTRD